MNKPTELEIYRHALEKIQYIYTVSKDSGRFSYRERDTVIPSIVRNALSPNNKFPPIGGQAIDG